MEPSVEPEAEKFEVPSGLPTASSQCEEEDPAVLISPLELFALRDKENTGVLHPYKLREPLEERCGLSAHEVTSLLNYCKGSECADGVDAAVNTVDPASPATQCGGTITMLAFSKGLKMFKGGHGPSGWQSPAGTSALDVFAVLDVADTGCVGRSELGSALVQQCSMKEEERGQLLALCAGDDGADLIGLLTFSKGLKRYQKQTHTRIVHGTIKKHIRRASQDYGVDEKGILANLAFLAGQQAVTQSLRYSPIDVFVAVDTADEGSLPGKKLKVGTHISCACIKNTR